MFDISRYIEDSVKASGVPVKVEDKAVLLEVANQVTPRTIIPIKTDKETSRVHSTYRKTA